MSNSEYQPISCALHSEYERLAMHQKPIRVILNEGKVLHGVIADIVTKSGAEFLLFTTAGGDHIEIRLDRIKEIAPKQHL